MGRRASNFKETDVKRAVKAVEAAGKEVETVEIEDGRIRITIKRGNRAADKNDDNANPWDEVDLK